MSAELLIPVEYLLCLQHFAGEEKLAYVAYEIGRGESYIVAMDGVILGCFRLKGGTGESTEGVIPLNVVQAIERLFGVVGEKVKLTVDGRKYTILCNDITLSGEAPEVDFPPWRDAFTERAGSGCMSVVAYNDALIRMQSAYRALHGYRLGGPKIIDAGSVNPFISFDHPAFAGAIAPLLDEIEEPPSWVPSRRKS